MEREQLHVRIDSRDLRELERIATRDSLSVAFIIRRLVRVYLQQRSQNGESRVPLVRVPPTTLPD